jgi:hypothetical protein
MSGAPLAWPAAISESACANEYFSWDRSIISEFPLKFRLPQMAQE